MPPAPPHRRSLQHLLGGAFTEHLPLKFAALFFSLLLWLVVSAEEPTDEWVGVRTSLVLDSGVVLLDSVPRVQALVVGKASELLKLYSALPELRRTPANLADTMVVVELRAADVDLPAGVDARVRDVRPHVLRLHTKVAPPRPGGRASGR
ncbi:MAG TPA: hypothetical protein VEI06_17385 [Gemmatimonadaceae bacterium]|nr:hypothetical protein [Gemmatimonadaceae bacterium]